MTDQSPAGDAPKKRPYTWEDGIAKAKANAMGRKGTLKGGFEIEKGSELCNSSPLNEGGDPTGGNDRRNPGDDVHGSPAGELRHNPRTPSTEESDYEFLCRMRRRLVQGIQAGSADADNAKGGRPPALDDLAKAEILALLSVGLSQRRVAAYVGCDPSTIWRTAQRDPDFHRDIRRALAKAELKPLLRVVDASQTSWRAAAWLTKRNQSKSARKRKARDEEDQRSDYEKSDQYKLDMLDRLLEHPPAGMSPPDDA